MGRVKDADAWELDNTLRKSTGAEISVDCLRNLNVITISSFPLLVIELLTKVVLAHFVVQIFKSLTIMIFCLLALRTTRKPKLPTEKQNFSLL